MINLLVGGIAFYDGIHNDLRAGGQNCKGFRSIQSCIDVIHGGEVIMIVEA